MNYREHLSLDGYWDFWTDPDGSHAPETLDPGQARRVQVPAPWQSQADELRFYSGVGWYQRQVEVPAAWRDGRIIVGFNASDYATQVWWNGTHVGANEGGYLPFQIDVTQAVRPGLNTLTVRVADLLDEFPEVPHGKQSWYGPLSGLWQPVWLEQRPVVHLTGLRITANPKAEQIEVEASLSQPVTAPAVLTFAVFAPDGSAASTFELPLPQGTSAGWAILPVAQPQLWDTDHPNLYQLHVTLQTGPSGAPSDGLSDTFGFRTIAAEAGRLLLNGRPLYLRGALDQDYYPELISTPPSQAYIEDSFRKAKAMGLNCLRVHIKVADPRYYFAADQVGLLIWTELPNWSQLTPAAVGRGRDTIEGMLRRDWNHPSIIIWTIINEDWGTELYGNPDHRLWLAEMFAWLKALDPARLVVDNSPCYPNSHVTTDIDDFHFYRAIPDHYRDWRDWVEAFAGRPGWTFSQDDESARPGRDNAPAPWRPLQRQPAPEVKRLGSEPLVVSEFGNWGLPDVDRLRAGNGGQEPWWFETGQEWEDGVVYPHGIEQRFRSYFLDRVFPTLSALSAASQRMQFVALKYEIEQMRRQPNIAGYVITEFTDVHWEANGLLDMCRNPKAFYDVIGQINSDDVIVPDWDRVAFWEGERCRVRLTLSHFSAENLEGSRLVWNLDGWREIGGVQAGLAPGPATTTRLKTITFEVPAVDHGARARLELRLYTATGRLAASNSQDLYFLPRRAGLVAGLDHLHVYAPELQEALASLGYRLVDSLEAADVAVVRTLTSAVRAYLQRGGSVLWMGESPQSLQTQLGGLRLAARDKRVWQGDWASNFNWIRQDRLFREIPTGGVVDFAFADLTPDHVILGLKQLDFAANVHAGLFVGWLHRPVALIAEQPIGKGRLLICTFRLRQRLPSQPVAAVMLRDMLVYLAPPVTSSLP